MMEEIKGKHCPYCEDVGWYARMNCSNNPWEAEQIQCEWCITNLNSVFNLTRHDSGSKHV